MARFEYTGTAQSSPEIEAPNDIQRIDPSPNSFGAQIGQGVEAVGQGAFKAADFYGQVAADEATNNFLDTRDKLLYGDPSKTVVGPDGQAAPDTGFLGLRGADAMRAAPQVQEQLDDALKEQQEGLETPAARQAFENQSRRYRAQTLEQIGTHTDEQQKIWATDTNQTTATIALSGVARNAGDDAAVAPFQEQVRHAYAKNAQLAGLDTQGALLKADQDVALARIRSLVGSDDPAQRAAAQKVLDSNSGVLSSLPNYDGIVREVRGAVVEATLDPTVDGLVTGALTSAQKSVGVPGAPVAAFAPAGPGYDRVRAQAQKDGAAPDEVDLALRTAHAESGGNPDATSPSGTYRGAFQYPKTGPQSVEDQTTAFLTEARTNKAALIAAGVTPSESDLYLMHQQGPAGGKMLLTSPPDAGAIAAITPAYHSNVAVATQAIAGNIGMPYRTPAERAAANQAASTMTSGQFRDLWSQRFGDAGATQYPTTADSLRAQMPTLVENARTALERQFPNQPDVVDRGVDRFERQLNVTITQNEQQYTVDTHIVQGAMEGGKPINERELEDTSPEVAAAWQRMQLNSPLAAAGVEKMFDANARGGALVYGAQFKDYLDRALAPSTDPNRISNPSQLYPGVGSTPDSPLTNTGVSQISRLLTLRGTAAGEAQAAQIKGFVDQMHGQLTFSNKVTGVYDQKGEVLYSKFMAQALPILEQAAKNGTLPKVLDPNSPDYVGKAALPFQRSGAEIADDHVKYAVTSAPKTIPYTPDTLRQDLDSLDNDQQRHDALRAAVTSHRLTAQTYQAYLDAKAGKPHAPAALVAPRPAEYEPGRGYVVPGQ